jgi:hypothetical protein
MNCIAISCEVTTLKTKLSLIEDQCFASYDIINLTKFIHSIKFNESNSQLFEQ